MKEWLSNLGEKSSRTDLWVILIVLTYITCLFKWASCDFHITQITILSGMFIDLGIDTIATKINKDAANNK